MPEAWPSSLQPYLNTAGFSENSVDTSIKTAQGTGPRKRRNRYTKPIENIKCSIKILRADYQDFKDFYNLTLQGGTLSFYFDHPITGDTNAVWCIDSYSTSPLGGEWFSISMEWERII